MVLGTASWRKVLANGLLAVALILAHSLPVAVPAARAAHGHHHAAVQHHVPAKASAQMEACQSCPGMAEVRVEPLPVPVGTFVTAFAFPASETGRGILPSLDTPPPKSVLSL